MTIEPDRHELVRLALLLTAGIAFWIAVLAAFGPGRVTVDIPFTPFEATFKLSF